MLVKWLTSRLIMDDKEQIDIRYVYNQFCSEEGDKTHSSVCISEFTKHLLKIFPHVKRGRTRRRGIWKTVYKGIGLKPLQLLKSETLLFHELPMYIPEDFQLITTVSEDNNEFSFKIDSGCLTNGVEVYKTITFKDDQTWSLKICGQSIDLENILISNVYELDVESILHTCDACRNILLCKGVPVSGTALVTKCQILENWSENCSQPAVRTLRSHNCLHAVTFTSLKGTCKPCRTMTILETEKPCKLTEEEILEKEQTDKIKHLLKHGDKELVDLFMEQSRMVDCKKTRRRWSKSLIGTFVHMYDTSPEAYNVLVESNMLILPSPSTLFCYIKKLQQNPEFFEELFAPMINGQNSGDDVKPDDATLDNELVDHEKMDEAKPDDALLNDDLIDLHEKWMM
ncbi:hypothetical protein ACF0H5_011554 [Mactra antiquata]